MFDSVYLEPQVHLITKCLVGLDVFARQIAIASKQAEFKVDFRKYIIVLIITSPQYAFSLKMF